MGNQVVPSDRRDKIQWFRDRITAWSAANTSIGLTAAQCTAMAAAITAAENSEQEAEEIRAASKAATVKFYGDTAAMGSLGSSLVSTIRAFAEQSSNPTNVYNLSMVPPPAVPSSVPAPGTPTDWKVELLQDGSIVLKWKCKNPAGASGTIYEVRRAELGSDDWQFIGATGVRSFSDAIPKASPGVSYQITAVRSTRRGNPAVFDVRLGTSGGGFFATVTPTSTPGENTTKLAA
ncbi:MAG TPA: fibronectin type III domain-containing protein [Phycisphaerales bacterium]|nr:fibronectin type III domain-containing protein [Phycisphaerales bacterium]